GVPVVDRARLVTFLSGIAVGCILAFPAAYAVVRGRPATPRATSADPAELARHVQTLVAKGQRALDEGKPDQAIVEFLRADQIDPRNAVVQNNLCVANTLLRRYDDALGACKAALNLEPDFQLAKNNLAWALSEREKSEAATPR
ncbi:MAG TPA: hypothetical protein VMS65_11065, partial [Polyangiaceae bacterium]|nr:hypothetical protein [Polyangiaceae bacterium]